jgi:tripartite-type tricarboxylate transporter receptor subunit TctC
MLMLRLAAFFLFGLMAPFSTPLPAQEYPTKPVRILTSPPGGGNDFVARFIAQALTGPLGQSVLVDNRANLVPIEAAAKASPDGYTLLVASSSFVSGHLFHDVSYDPVRDFATITHLGNAPNALVVHPSVPVKNVKELVNLAKRRPGDLNYGSSGAGSSAYLAAELLKSTAHINLTRITYRGNGASLIGLISGEIQLLFPTVPSAAPYVKSGRLRALAVTGLERSVLAPEIPTMASSGLPGYKIESIYGLLAPAKTPSAIINRLDQEMVRFIKTPAAREKLLTIGIEPVTSTPDQYAALIKNEIARMTKLVKAAGIRGEAF